jgi:hypothetical protein
MADAGLGIILSDRPPYTILNFSPNGPAAEAARQGLIQLNDVLDQVNNVSVSNLEKSQVHNILAYGLNTIHFVDSPSYKDLGEI